MVLSDDSAHHYQGDAGREYHLLKRRLPEVAFPWVTRLRVEKFQPFVDETMTVVEFGVGAGWNLSNLLCTRRIGVDVADFLADDVRDRGVEFVTDSSTIEDDLADVVICHHMLEHVISPADTLLEMRRVLRPGGTLLLFVPFETQRRWQRYDADEPNHHLYAWSVQSLGALVFEVGFSVRDASLGRYGYDRVAASLAVRAHTGERGFRLLRRAMHLVAPVHEVCVVAIAAG